jgi:hypothetical protein
MAGIRSCTADAVAVTASAVVTSLALFIAIGMFCDRHLHRSPHRAWPAGSRSPLSGSLPTSRCLPHAMPDARRSRAAASVLIPKFALFCGASVCELRNQRCTSVPIPKFRSFCGTLICELRNRRTLATY